MLLLIAIVIVVGLIWKWLDIRSLAELQNTLAMLVSGNGQHFLSNLFQVDEKTKRNGGELVAAVLKAHDVKEIFMLCGGHISPIIVAAEKLGIRIVDTRHEVTAVFAADAVARLRQSIGVAAVTAGPGLTNTITAVKNAQMAESPLLLIGGAAPSLLKGRGALQDIDQLVLFRPLCKFAARIERLRDIAPTVRKAIQAATSGTPGPVFVEFPVDVLYPYELVMKEIGINPNAHGLQKVINAYLRCHVSRQFGNAFAEQEITPLPHTTPLAKGDDISKLVELVRNAKRPVLLLGSQATLAPVKPSALVEAVKTLGMPVYLGGMARGLLGKESDLQMRQNRRDALKEADLTILAGTVCDFRLSYGRVLSKKSKIVAINRNSSQLTKNEKAFWNSDLSIQADVGSTLVAVANQLKASGHQPNKEWVKTLRESDNAKEAANAKKCTEVAASGHINPLNFLSRLDKVIPDNAILVADGGDFVGSAAYIVRPRGPLQWLDPGAFGTLGVGGGFALGAKVVHPDRPVYILWGDGSCGYSIMEFDTFTRHKLGVTGIIGNDACWTQIAREQVPMFSSNVGVDLTRARYDEVAKALGANGAVLDLENVDQTEEILNKLAQAKSTESTVLNVFIGKTDFREGSISV